MQPLLRNVDIMNGGCECLVGIQKDINLNAVDVILAIMSIARYYYPDLQSIQAHRDVPEIQNIQAGLLENIRKILIVLQRSPLSFSRSTVDRYFAPYLSKYKHRLSGTAPGPTRDNIIESGMRCYGAMLSLCVGSNQEFFKQLTAGADIARSIMNENVQDWEWDYDLRQAELNKIISSISACKLTNPSMGLSKDGFELYLQRLP